ncbi:hypothetical protein BaRGS_00014937 [Batillaria attramentaria]|uniref:Uncharacterized protein n=1 Tax=Batillaria attramentaria TaxID=370345 RepID=A0ABD0L2P9_9CAEN
MVLRRRITCTPIPLILYCLVENNQQVLLVPLIVLFTVCLLNSGHDRKTALADTPHYTQGLIYHSNAPAIILLNDPASVERAIRGASVRRRYGSTALAADTSRFE